MRIIFCCLLLSLATLESNSAQIDCANALEIEVGVYLNDTIVGTQPSPENCTGEHSNGTRASWYTFSVEEETSVMVTTDFSVNEGRDTRFHILAGSCDTLYCVGGDDDGGSGFLSVDFFNAEPGITYYLVFDNRWENNPFYFQIMEQEVPVVLLDFTSTELSASGSELAVVDMDGDFLDDVVSVSNDNGVFVSLQRPEGVFDTLSLSNAGPMNYPGWSMAAGDYDANGYNDLVFGNGSAVSFARRSDDGQSITEIAFPEYVFSQRTNFVDINNDGNLDCFVCHDVQPNVFYINDGENNFDYFQGGLGDIENGGNYGSIWIDFDNDGDQDMFIAKCRGGSSTININELHRNNGDGTFTEVAAHFNLADPVQTWSSAWGDFDNDGDMDVFVGASSLGDGGHKLMRNDGNTFTDVTEGTILATMTATSLENVTHDFNNDGYLDLMGGGGRILLSNGDMTFTATSVNFGHGPMGDLNNDGFIDVMNNNRLHLNVGNENNYLKVNLTGTVSNRNGIGARVEVHSALGQQMRQVQSGTGFRYMSSLNAHFGLGTDEVVDSLVIRWPSGVVDVIYEPEINASFMVVEGSFLSGINEPNVATLSVFPNPAADQLNIGIENLDPDSYGQIYSLDGKLVDELKVNDRSLDVSHLRTGTYLLFLRQSGQTYQAKFIKR